MIDLTELKRRAEALIGLDDIPLAPDVILALIAENEELSVFGVAQRAFEEAFTLRHHELIAERDQIRAEVAGLKAGYEAYERVNAELKVEVQALRKDAERWRFFSVLANDLQAFPHVWGKMTPEKMDAMCDQAMADAALGQGEQS